MPSEEQAEKLRKAQEEARREDHLIAQRFKGRDGEESLNILRRLFYDRLSFKRGDSHYTAFREGQRDVVGFIIQAIKGER